jgi:hypothetical protein
MTMRNFWIVAFISVTLTTAGVPSPTIQLASAQEAAEQSQAASLIDRALNGGLVGNPTVQYASQELCGIGLGGYCPRGYRGCIRAGRPKAECEARLARCDACNQAMVDCRQKVGHQAGYTCAECRQALDKCRASLSAPVK